MKLYHFNPNDYGQEYFVMSDSKENALNAVINSNAYGVFIFINATIDNLPKRYTLEEYDINKVVRTESA